MNFLYVDPVAFNLFSKPVYWYGIIISLTIFLGYYVAELEARKRNLKKDTLLDLLLLAVPVSLLTARLYYVLFRWDYYSKNKNEILSIWDGGLAIYGGLIGGIMVLILFSKKNKINVVKLLDIIAPSLLIGQMLGRWGNFFNHEAYGEVVSKEVLENLFIPNFIIENMYIVGEYRHPTFLYESIWCLLSLIIIFFVRKNLYKGEVISLYLVLYGFERFFVEGMRADSLYLGSFRISQIVSLLMFVLGIIIIIRTRFFAKNPTKYINS